MQNIHKPFAGLTLEASLKQFEDVEKLDKFPVRVLGVRGHQLSLGPTAGNDVEAYDDLIVIIDGTGRAINYRASVDPTRYYIRNPVNPDGCARLRVGLYWFEKGLHRGHQAFTQNGPVVVERLDKLGKIISIQAGEFGINLHSGGGTLEDTDRWSAGCQVIYSPEGGWDETWLHFEDTLSDALKLAKQTVFPYLLVDKLKALNP